MVKGVATTTPLLQIDIFALLFSPLIISPQYFGVDNAFNMSQIKIGRLTFMMFSLGGLFFLGAVLFGGCPI